MVDVDIREAEDEQLPALNQLYASIHFAPSALPQDRTFFAASSLAPIVGLGRINQYDDGALEIGGFWVLEAARRGGLARRMVGHVISALPPRRTVYCVPFLPLVKFYQSFGMQPVESRCSLPRSISKKLGYCGSQRDAGHYEHEFTVLLFHT